MDWKVLAICCATGFGLTVARRINNNSNSDAGSGAAAFTVIAMIIYIICDAILRSN